MERYNNQNYNKMKTPFEVTSIMVGISSEEQEM